MKLCGMIVGWFLSKIKKREKYSFWLQVGDDTKEIEVSKLVEVKSPKSFMYIDGMESGYRVTYSNTLFSEMGENEL